LGDYTVVGNSFTWDDGLAGDFPLTTQLATIKGSQGMLARYTALGQSLLTIGAAVAGVHTGTETIAQPTLQAGAIPGVYKLTCTAVNGGVGTFSVINPKGVRLADLTQAVAYTDQIGLTVAGGAAVAADTYTITVSTSGAGLQVSNIAEGVNGGGATLTAATIHDAAAIAGEYLITCTAVVDGVGTYSVVGPGGALANATQAVAYTTQIGFTIGGDPPDVGDSFIVTVSPGIIELVVCSNTAVDGSAVLWGLVAEPDGVDTTNGDVLSAVYVTGKFNEAAVTFAAGDSYANHLNDKATIFLVPIHP